MSPIVSIVGNVLLYGFLLWQLYECTFVEHDYWFTYVVGFVVVLAAAITVVPGVRAPRVSPGQYPYDD